MPSVTLPVLNAPLSAVRVWITWSSFFTVTAAPGPTVKYLGIKAKFLIDTVIAAIGLAGAGKADGEDVCLTLVVAHAARSERQARVASITAR